MKNHHTKTSLLPYNTKNRYRNNIESLIFLSLLYPPMDSTPPPLLPKKKKKSTGDEVRK
jgi:hypothetical protein